MIGLDPQQVTIVALLLAIGGAGLKKLWVWGWQYTDEVARTAEAIKDRDFWRDIALQSMGHVDHVLDAAAKQGRR